MNARHARATGAAIVILGLLAGCSAPQPRAQKASAPFEAAAPKAAEGTVAGCAVTRPSGRPQAPAERLPPDPGPQDRWFGEGPLWVSLPGADYHGEREKEGYRYKMGWWRLAEGRLRLAAEPVDGLEGSATTHVPSGYGPTGLQPTGVLFSGAGCWRVTGSLGDTTVAFVMKVG